MRLDAHGIGQKTLALFAALLLAPGALAAFIISTDITTGIWMLTVTAQADHNGEYVISGVSEGDISPRVSKLPAQ